MSPPGRVEAKSAIEQGFSVRLESRPVSLAGRAALAVAPCSTVSQGGASGASTAMPQVRPMTLRPAPPPATR
jgi:hypothetical protein